MTWWQAIILGIVEGLTEYIPVSSTGHLILAQRIMGIPSTDANDAYAIVIQAGAILAVLGLYYRRMTQMGRGLLGRDDAGRRLAINILIGVLPAVVLGLALEKWIKAYLFGDAWGLWPTVAAWLIGGLAILAVTWWRRRREPDPARGLAVDDITWRMALFIGLLQCVAMWPGTSRSLMTIVAGVLVGLSLPAAVEFSFLLGVITLIGAAGKDMIEYREPILHEVGWTNLLLGTLFATIAAAIAIKWMLAYLRRHSLALFGWYRVGLAVAVAALILLEVLDAATLDEALKTAPGTE